MVFVERERVVVGMERVGRGVEGKRGEQGEGFGKIVGEFFVSLPDDELFSRKKRKKKKKRMRINIVDFFK